LSAFAPKAYQSQVLESIEAYFKACHELPSPSIAFTATTERLWGRGLPYTALGGFPPDMPYICLRVPTGGGKTWLAAKSIVLVNTHLLRCEHSVIWSHTTASTTRPTARTTATAPTTTATGTAAHDGSLLGW
jgi:type III restriction enzyme